MNDTVFLILGYLVLVGAERLYMQRRGRKYSTNVALSNMGCGLLSLCVGVVSVGVFAILYRLVETHMGLMEGLGWQW